MSETKGPPEVPGEVWRERDERGCGSRQRWIALVMREGEASVYSWWDAEPQWKDPFAPSPRILIAWAKSEHEKLARLTEEHALLRKAAAEATGAFAGYSGSGSGSLDALERVLARKP